MSWVYRPLKTTWRRLAPETLHDSMFGGKSALSRFVLAIKGQLERGASHDEIYDADYYARYTNEMTASAIGMVDSIIKSISPESVIDVGCGSGEVIQRFRKVGVDACGVELSEAALKICKFKNLTVFRFDLEDVSDELPETLSADLVISTEVAEHLPVSCADRFVSTLCKLAKRYVIVTAATPGQGGTDHVNEQPYDYWIKKFGCCGAVFLEDLTRQMRNDWNAAGVEASRARNVMVFALESNQSILM
jgi:SAM-dependent methyltransferase